MKKLILAALVGAASLSTGCMSSAKLVRELSRDNAAISAEVNTIYGTARLRRVNPPAGASATITPDGTITYTVPPTNSPAVAPRK